MDATKIPTNVGSIGIFDSGYGGLTILEQVRKGLPRYDYLYLGDNARAPYGTRSFEIVYEFTKQAVFHLFDEGCSLVILACNTASAKALRSILVSLPINGFWGLFVRRSSRFPNCRVRGISGFWLHRVRYSRAPMSWR